MSWFLSLLFLLPFAQALHNVTNTDSPFVQIRNGTVQGRYSPEYNQDFFLGIPYAQPPVGDLRFKVPQSINASFGTLPAKEYSSECIGYAVDQWAHQISEDCLYLNVIRPANHEASKLPVAFFIHGGALSAGGASDQRYNLSFMVENSVKIGKPVIGVSINYRLSAWGFLNSLEVAGTGNTNLGLRDQRLALHWVQENIEAFGGDASKVTVFGQSAGASSVSLQLTAYGGRDDKLMRGAIMQSLGYSVQGNSASQSQFNTLANKTGCEGSTDVLNCLRHVPYESLNEVINTTSLGLTSWAPTIDGDFIQEYPSIQFAAGKFLHVPIINGATSDEGVSFSGTINTTDQFTKLLGNTGIPSSFIPQLLEAYPDVPKFGIPGSPPLGPLPPDFRYGFPQGAQYRRVAAYGGDSAFHAPRRLMSQTWAAANLSAYSYRFNALPAGQHLGVGHGHDLGFMFYNLQGVGYPEVMETPPFEGKGQSYTELARLMNSAWISFVHDLDPNTFRTQNSTEGGFSGMQLWPKYSIENPQNFVFDANVTSHPEPDTWRKEAIKLINDNVAGVYHR